MGVCFCGAGPSVTSFGVVIVIIVLGGRGVRVGVGVRVFHRPDRLGYVQPTLQHVILMIWQIQLLY